MEEMGQEQLKDEGLRRQRKTSLQLIFLGADNVTGQKAEFHNGNFALALIFKPPLHKFFLCTCKTSLTYKTTLCMLKSFICGRIVSPL